MVKYPYHTVHRTRRVWNDREIMIFNSTKKIIHHSFLYSTEHMCHLCGMAYQTLLMSSLLCTFIMKMAYNIMSWFMIRYKFFWYDLLWLLDMDMNIKKNKKNLIFFLLRNSMSKMIKSRRDENVKECWIFCVFCSVFTVQRVILFDWLELLWMNG